MKKERTIKELLQLMLEHQELFSGGFCFWVRSLYWDNIMTQEERNTLDKYIKENRPKNLSWLLADAFYWKSGNIKPRIKWIKKHIARL
jgi:hypothetical protein